MVQRDLLGWVAGDDYSEAIARSSVLTERSACSFGLHRRTHLQDIVVHTDTADQHAALAHEIDQSFGLCRRWGLGFTIADELDREKQPGAAHISDELETVRELCELREGVVADGAGILDQVFVLDHIEHGCADRGRNRVAAKRIEVHVAGRKLVNEIAARDHAGKRVSIAHGFSHGDDVGNDAELLVSP